MIGLASALDDARGYLTMNGDAKGLAVLDDAEAKAVNRICALVEAHPDPSIKALSSEWVPRQSRRKGDTEPTTLFDVARRFARKVPLTKLVSLEDDVCPYLACVIIDAILTSNETLVVPANLPLERKPKDKWEEYKATMAGRTYQAYGSLSKAVENA